MIKQLSKQTAQDLCAQQVITSINDCIKQLIDNSIDAQATKIQICLQDYGKKSITVHDDGRGISCFEVIAQKGATSKNTGNNSQEIGTLGFRGQALHSIAKVSQNMQISSAHNCKNYSLNLKTGQLTLLTSTRQHGTTVIIQSLFQYLPVRRYELMNKYKQFLKKTDEMVKQYCLIYYNVGFIVRNQREGRSQLLIETTAHRDIESNNDNKGMGQRMSQRNWLLRVKEILGNKIAESLIYISTQNVKGWILKNIQSGSSRQNTFIRKHLHYLYLNNRPIDPIPKITSVLDQYYKKYNKSTKYAYIINLVLPWQTYDVNLTPNKRQILIKINLLESIVEQIKGFIQKNVVESVPVLEEYQDKIKGQVRSQAQAVLGKDKQICKKNQRLDSFVTKKKLNQDQNYQNGCCKPIHQNVSNENEFREQTNYRSSENLQYNKLKLNLQNNLKDKRQQQNKSSQPIQCQQQNRKSKKIESIADLQKQIQSKKRQRDLNNQSENKSKILQKLNQTMSLNNTNNKPHVSYHDLGIRREKQQINNQVMSKKYHDNNRQQIKKQQNEKIIVDHIRLENKNKGIDFKSVQEKDNVVNQDQNPQNLQKSQKNRQQNLQPQIKLQQQQQQAQFHNIDKQSFKNFKILGQFNHGFIVCIFNNKYYLVDQHAASQKYHFQKLLAATRNRAQIHDRIAVSPVQMDSILENKDKLQNDGYRFQVVDRSTIVIQSVPVFLQKRYGKQYFMELALSEKCLNQLPDYYNAAATKACRTAVMVGHVLQPNQMKDIVSELSNLKSPWNCPHGRPTLIYLGQKQQIEKCIKSNQREYTF